MNYPHWTGTYHLRPQGTVMRWRLFGFQPVPTFEFHNCPDDPLTLHTADGVWFQPFRRFDGFDFGSVPLILQSIVSPLAADKAFALHDSSYEFGAVWTERGMIDITRREADNLLYIGMRAQGCSRYTAGKAWSAVRIGGGGIWARPHDSLENLRRDAQAHASPQGT